MANLTVAKLSLTAGAIFITICAFEMFLRVQEPILHLMQERYNHSAMHVGHDVWHHWPRPSAAIVVAAREPRRYPEPIHYIMNSFGCRYSRELQLPKPRAVKRILVLGDSFTAGYYYEDTVAATLERHLNTDSNTRFEVVNCGSSSYSPLLHYLRLKHQLAKLEPDEIILNLDLTDVYDDYWRYRQRTAFIRGEPVAVAGSSARLRDLTEWAKHQLYVARLLATVRASGFPRALGASEERQAPTPANVFWYYRSGPNDSAEWELEVAFFLENISRILLFCRDRGIAVTVTMYPHRQQLEADANGERWHREVEQRVKELCEKLATAFYSAYEGIEEAFKQGDDVYWKDDMHFTPVGQRIWAGLISSYFVSQAR